MEKEAGVASNCVEDSCPWLVQQTEKHRHVTSGRLPCSSSQPKALFSWYGVVVVPIDFSCLCSPITSVPDEVYDGLGLTGHFAVTVATVCHRSLILWFIGCVLLVWVYWFHPKVKKYSTCDIVVSARFLPSIL